MTCRGCGRSYEYAIASIEFEREIEFEGRFEPEPQPVAPAVSPPPPIPLSPGAPGKPPRRGRLETNWAKNRAITAGLLVVAVAALAFAVTRLSGETGGSTAPTAPVAADREPAPRPVEASKARSKQAEDAAPSEPEAKASPPAKPPARPVAGEKLVATPRFTLVVPDSWARRAAGTGLALAPPGDPPVSILAFSEENPAMSLETMIAGTEEFLSSRAPSGTVGNPRELLVGGNPAFELRDTGPAGSQAARGVLAGPYRDLVVTRVRADAPAAMRAAAARALHSFRPR